MRGLYIEFNIKRRKKINKVMDYFLSLAIFILVFVFGFYVQFVQKENKYNSSYKELQSLSAERDELKENVNAKQIENASTFEKNYNAAYNELATLVDSSAIYVDYINDIYAAVLDGVTITSIKIDPSQSQIELGLYFDKEKDSQVDYRYRAALLDYEWIPINGIDYSDFNVSTHWVIHTIAPTTEGGAE